MDPIIQRHWCFGVCITEVIVEFASPASRITNIADSNEPLELLSGQLGLRPVDFVKDPWVKGGLMDYKVKEFPPIPTIIMIISRIYCSLLSVAI